MPATWEKLIQSSRRETCGQKYFSYLGKRNRPSFISDKNDGFKTVFDSKGNFFSRLYLASTSLLKKTKKFLHLFSFRKTLLSSLLVLLTIREKLSIQSKIISTYLWKKKKTFFSRLSETSRTLWKKIRSVSHVRLRSCVRDVDFDREIGSLGGAGTRARCHRRERSAAARVIRRCLALAPSSSSP